MTSATEQLSRKVREKQISAADPSASAWVRANAGSGKTRVLVDRLLRLLLEGVPPAQILALTFTKAAAAEMKERLQKVMGDWAGCDDQDLTDKLHELTGTTPTDDHLSRAHALFAVALETPGGLKIQTIHGFCQAVLERFSVEAGVPANFSVIEDQDAHDLKQAAQAQLLARVFASGASQDTNLSRALQIVIDEAGEHGFATVLHNALYQAGQFETLFAQNEGPLGAIAHLSSMLALPVDTDPLALPDIDSLDPAFDLAAIGPIVEQMARDGSQRDQERAAEWLPYCEKQTAETLALFCKGFLTSQNKPRKESTLITAKLDKAISGKPVLLAARDEALRLLDLERSYKTRRRTAALLIVIDHILRDYAAAKGERGALDYADLILKTRTLLERSGGAGWVLYKLDQGIDHILVDEAQDTSPDQWAIIEALSTEFFAGSGSRPDTPPERPRTIFAVGDEKQSIYRFQGADPSGFARMADKFGNAIMALDQDWRDIELEVSFRSAPAILRFVDSVFATDNARQGLAATDAPPAHIAYRQGAPGMIVRWPIIEPPQAPDDQPWLSPVDAPRPDSPLNRLAGRIADELKYWFDSNRTLPAQGRQVRPGDILILLRARGAKLDALVRALKNRNVPVAGADRMVLNDQIAIMDLIALGDWALFPDDDLMLATLLKGPFCGMREQQLFTLAHNRKGTLWEQLNDYANNTPGSVEAKARDWLAPLIDAAATLRPFDFFALVLEQKAGRKRLLSRLGAQATDPINEFFARCMGFEQGRTASLQSFLHAMRQDQSELKRDMEKSDDAVRIMTVHGAKGLEAPIVIMPDLMSPPQKKQIPPLLPVEQGLPPLWRKSDAESDPVTRKAADAYMAEERAEYRRLLYVGLTRAQDELYLCGYKGKQSSKDEKWHDYVSAPEADKEETFPFLDGDDTRLVNADEGAVVKPDEKPDSAQNLTPAPVPHWALGDASTERPDQRPLAPSALVPYDGAPAARTANSPLCAQDDTANDVSPLKRGNLLHLLLEVLPDIAPANRRATATRILSQPAHGLPDATITAWTDEIMAVFDNPDFAPLFGPGSIPEVPITGLIGKAGGSLALSGQIDRLAVTEDDVLIIDYKTNQPPPKKAAEVAPVYVAQMAAYRALLGQIYPNHKVRAALLFTDSCALIELTTRQLDQAAKKITGLSP